nr:p47 [Calliteara abietis nucleopolyhedrovirus]
MAFARYYNTRTQWLPQCCKYLADELCSYQLYLQDFAVADFVAASDDRRSVEIIESALQVNDEGFVRIRRTYAAFDLKHLNGAATTLEQIDHYVDATRKQLSAHDKRLFKLLIRSRYYKSDFVRMEKMLTQTDVGPLIGFACNVMWERGYENHYTLGQQLSIRITTKFIQSGLDFKHQTSREEQSAVSRGWDNAVLEKFLNSITSISDVIKRHRCCKKYMVLELAPAVCDDIKRYLRTEFAVVVHNRRFANLCAIEIDADKNSELYLKKFTYLLRDKLVNLLFVTDMDYYLKRNNFLFYLYNSLKLYYYCLTNKFVFYKSDYEIIFYLYIIVMLEWHNGGHLNSFTLEKSLIYNPLELSTRRLNSIKRAATQARVVSNDNEIKIDFIKGKRIKTGTNYGHRVLTM